MKLSDRLASFNEGMSVRLYSDYPFPWRQSDGGARDAFEREALQYLQEHPQQTFSRIEPFQGHSALRYAQADILKPSCLECHNTHPDSPKTDWQVGDVRGILEVTLPLDRFMQQTRQGLQSTTERFKQRAESGEMHPGHRGIEFLPYLRDTLMRGWSVPITIESEIIAIDTTDLNNIDYRPAFQAFIYYGALWRFRSTSNY